MILKRHKGKRARALEKWKRLKKRQNISNHTHTHTHTEGK